MFSGMFKTGIGGICGTVGNIKSHCAHMDVFLIFHIQAHFAFLSSLVHISVNDSECILILKTTFMSHFLCHTCIRTLPKKSRTCISFKLS